MAKSDPSPVVRLYLASAMQRLPLDDRWAIAASSAQPRRRRQRSQPAADVSGTPPSRWPKPTRSGRWRSACRAARRFRCSASSCSGGSAASKRQPVACRARRRARQVRTTPTSNWRFSTAFARHSQGSGKSRRRPNWQRPISTRWSDRRSAGPRRKQRPWASRSAMPRRWQHFGPLRRSPSKRTRTPIAAKRSRRLLDAKDPDLCRHLQGLLADPALRDVALTGPAHCTTIRRRRRLLARCIVELSPSRKTGRAGHALRPRQPTASRLLERDRRQANLPPTDLSADLVRQLHNLEDDEIDELLAEVWGIVRSTPADKAELIADYKQIIASPAAMPPRSGAGPRRVRQDLPAVPHAVRRRRQDRPRSDRLEPGRPRIPALEHRRSQRGRWPRNISRR